MSDTSGADVCAICLAGMARGQASFTAECSHAFHLACISASVAHGNRDCPLCKASWTVLPAVNAPPPSARRRVPPPPFVPQVFARYVDDETLEDQTAQAQAAAAANGNGAALVLEAHCECPAIARDASRDGFAVLVHAKAPAAAAAVAGRAPLDLVTVLDVSGSMTGRKLALLKQAMGFVIDNLGPADRLSVVSFSSGASRLIRLALMSDAGKALAKLAVESLVADGATNIGEGLRVASQVLSSRRYKNAVASIILLSDGQDTFVAPSRRTSGGATYMDLVPRSFTHGGSRPAPVHTFGFGTDHDAAAMHTIAEATGGTFSFVQNQAVLQDSFAQCIGGLLSVTIQDARIAVTCLHPGVRVREVKSGRYDSSVDADGRAASVDVGELYADEERRFLLFLDVPSAGTTDEVTRLVKVSCSYRDAATGQAADVAGDDAVVQRPVEATNVQVSMEVEREQVRVAAAEDIAAARAAADRGEHAEAARILDRRQEAIERSAAGDPTCEALADELRDLSARVADRREYQETGRACLLAGVISHAQQRASGMELFSDASDSDDSADPYDYDVDDEGAYDEEADEGSVQDCSGQRPRSSRTLQCARRVSKRRAYVTPTMERMVLISRENRQTAMPPPPPERTRSNSQQPDCSQSEQGKRQKGD